MKKTLIIFFLIFLINPVFASFFKKKQKVALILTSKNPGMQEKIDEIITPEFYFKKNSRIYFMISNPNGFKSDYIKYQIVKQDDNAHTGGYTRIRNITTRIKNKYYYSNYFTLSQNGKYLFQIFDIENLQQWLANCSFRVIDE